MAAALLVAAPVAALVAALVLQVPVLLAIIYRMESTVSASNLSLKAEDVTSLATFQLALLS